MVSLTWPQILRWRLRRQYVDPPQDVDAVGVTGRLCGVQAQVPAAAELAVAVRTARGLGKDLAGALSEGRLVRTWTVRGTLHVLPPSMAARQLSLMAAARTWHKGSWQRAFASLPVMSALAEHVWAALDTGPLTREELVAAIGRQMKHEDLAERLRSGWSALLKPLAWQGILCQGPPRGRNVTFARPDRLLENWDGLPNSDEAGPEVVRDYLAVFGPATIDAFDAWLLRGGTPKTQLRSWFGALEEEIAQVDVEGRTALVRSADLDELAAIEPDPGGVHLLPAFDQYLLGPGTSDPAILAPEHRALVSRAGGWISPVVLLGGRVAGTWETINGESHVSPFPEVKLPRDELSAAVHRMGTILASASPA
jgi:hypothetical protein